MAIRVDKPANAGVIIPALEVIEPGLYVVVVATVAQGVQVCDMAGTGDRRASIIGNRQELAPGVVAVPVVGRQQICPIRIAIGIGMRHRRRARHCLACGQDVSACVVGVRLGIGRARPRAAGILRIVPGLGGERFVLVVASPISSWKSSPQATPVAF